LRFQSFASMAGLCHNKLYESKERNRKGSETMDHQDICPYCHGRNFVLARQRGDGRLTYSEIVTLEPGTLYHILCLNCGTVVRTFMDDPSVLLTLEEEDEQPSKSGIPAAEPETPDQPESAQTLRQTPEQKQPEVKPDGV